MNSLVNTLKSFPGFDLAIRFYHEVLDEAGTVLLSSHDIIIK